MRQSRDVIARRGAVSPGEGIIPLREMPRFSLAKHVCRSRVSPIIAAVRHTRESANPIFLVDTSRSLGGAKLLLCTALPFNCKSNMKRH